MIRNLNIPCLHILPNEGHNFPEKPGELDDQGSQLAFWCQGGLITALHSEHLALGPQQLVDHEFEMILSHYKIVCPARAASPPRMLMRPLSLFPGLPNEGRYLLR